PRYWQEAAAWLGDQPDSTTLVVPANRFGDYLWGSTGDDVMQPLAEASWVARPVVPLTPAGTVGLLDSVSDELAQGTSSEGLAVTLRRAGIDHVVVRFDLSNGVDPDRAEVAWQTLAA